MISEIIYNDVSFISFKFRFIYLPVCTCVFFFMVTSITFVVKYLESIIYFESIDI